jgi:hypothetical protein
MKNKIISYLVIGILLTTFCLTVQIESVKAIAELKKKLSQYSGYN